MTALLKVLMTEYFIGTDASLTLRKLRCIGFDIRR
jgi:hypothetical protein